MLTENMIVNHMLTTVGEGGVSTLETLHPSVATAKQILDTENLTFQGRGWWFNRENNIRLAQNEQGQVEVPDDTLAFTMDDLDQKSGREKLRYVKRGKFVYDTYLHTNKINRAIVATIVLRLPVQDMPLVASNFLMHRCAELMYVADDGDNFKSEKLTGYRMEAWQQLKAQEMTTLAVNALDNSVAASLYRGVGGGNFTIYGGGQR